MLVALLSLSFAHAAVHADAGLRYVSGAVSELEASTGEALGWLRPGTALRLLEVDGERARVTLLERPPEHPLEGWVPLETLSSSRPQAEEARAPATVDLALCRAGRAEWLGAVAPGGGLEDHLDEAVRERAARAAWFTDGETRALRGSPFAAPYFTEPSVDPGDAYGPSLGRTSTFRLVLGPCDVEGEVLTTAPGAGLQATALPREAIELVDSMAVTITEQPVALLDAHAVGPDLWAARYRGEGGRVSLLLTDAHGRPLEAFGPAWHVDAIGGAWGAPLAGEPVWLRLELDQGPATLMIAPIFVEAGLGAELLIMPESGAPNRLVVELDHWGC